VARTLTGQEVSGAVDGDLDAFSALLDHPQELRSPLRDSDAALVITTKALRRVLTSLQMHRVSPELVQQWASFVRRGYIAGVAHGPVSPLPIEYDLTDEGRIVDTIARLDEIGDDVDGRISAEELASMLSSLAP